VAKSRILIVDDDPKVLRSLRTALLTRGFEVNEARSSEEGLERTRSAKYDLVILEVNMPGPNGIKICQEIRASSNVPIIVLTVRTAEKDKTQAFEAGADGYVTKPFSVPELMGRVCALLRKGGNPLEFLRTRLRLGDIEIDFDAREIRGRKQQERLTPKEFALLSYMATHANRVVTHRELLQEVWGSETGGEKEYLRVFMNHLRKKVERAPEDPKYLLTEYWLGYRLRLPV
jgi:two-component system KDP operon response regulator KdpE